MGAGLPPGRIVDRQRGGRGGEITPNGLVVAVLRRLEKGKHVESIVSVAKIARIVAVNYNDSK